jgi:hypothetical protein
MKTADELHAKFSEFEALLEKSGKQTDGALRERLTCIWTGLASIVDKTPEEDVPAGQVEFHLNPGMFSGSLGTFREAQVDFEERHIVICAIDSGGYDWMLRSTKLPGPIVKDECRFMLCKTGQDLRVTLTKATADVAWHQEEIKFREQPCMSRSASNTRSTGSAGSSSQVSRLLSTPAGHATSSKTRIRSACSSSQSVAVQLHGCTSTNRATSEKLFTEEQANYAKAGATFF